jgi:hypothetical protein
VDESRKFLSRPATYCLKIKQVVSSSVSLDINNDMTTTGPGRDHRGRCWCLKSSRRGLKELEVSLPPSVITIRAMLSEKEVIKGKGMETERRDTNAYLCYFYQQIIQIDLHRIHLSLSSILNPHPQSPPLNLPYNPIPSQRPLLRHLLLINLPSQNPTLSPILHQPPRLIFPQPLQFQCLYTL